MIRKALVAGLLIALSSLLMAQTAPSTQPSRPDAIPKDWVQMKAGNAFTFWCPPDVKEIKQQGEDSFVGRYESATFKMSFDFGRYSKLNAPQYKRDKIDGKEAFLAQWEKGVGIYVPQVDDNKTMNKLAMSIMCDAGAAEDAVKILKSVKFTAAEPAAKAGK